MSELARLLRIKTGSVGRLRREFEMYTQDEVKETKNVDDLRAKGADPHDIKYAVREGEGCAPKMGRGCRGERSPDACALPGGARARGAAADPEPRPRASACARPAGLSPKPAPLRSARPPTQETLLTEAKAMVPDARTRLEAAVADLSKFLVRPDVTQGSGMSPTATRVAG